LRRSTSALGTLAMSAVDASGAVIRSRLHSNRGSPANHRCRSRFFASCAENKRQFSSPRRQLISAAFAEIRASILRTICGE
jgi:hypothetical protein